MSAGKQIEQLEAKISMITQRMEEQKRKDQLRSRKYQEKREILCGALRSICPHETIYESGEFVGCESGMRYEKWRICSRCGITLA